MKRQIIFLTVFLALSFSAGCTIANKFKIKETANDSAETGQSVEAEKSDKEELLNQKGQEGSPGVPVKIEEKIPVSPEKTQKKDASEINSKKQNAAVLEKKKPAVRDSKTEENIALSVKNIDDSQKIALNFDNADIYEVINSLSDILGINYIIDPAVKGKVNIHTSSEISRNQLLPVLETIFDMNNIALVKSGNIYKILPVKSAMGAITDIKEGKEVDTDSYDRTLIQVIPLQYVSSSEVIKILKPFLSKGGEIVEYKQGNILIAFDAAATIRKIVSLINIVDIDIFEHTGIHFFKIANAEVKELADELETVFSSFGIAKTTDKGIGIKFIPIERVSCILAVSAIPGIFEKAKHWIKILDTVDKEAEEQVFIYFVENGKAEEISDVLEKIYGDGITKNKSTKAKRPASSRATKKTVKNKNEGSSFIQGEIKIVTDEATNSIIVRSTPQDYTIIKDTISKLDIIPKQVLIEVLIAEVKLGDKTQFGVEWALRGDFAKIGGYKGQDRIGLGNGLGGLGTSLSDTVGSGLSYLFDSNRLKTFLYAQADDNKLNVLSSPSILAADNKEARIEVGEEVPIVTSEYVPMEQETNSSTSRSIEYRNTGIILTVTPRINDKGLVAMDVTQEVSNANEVAEGGIQSPVITNRRAETSLVVQNNQTIVIGGLIQTQREKSVTGVPFLSKIPFLGYFFSRTIEKDAKVELIILITPHVIETIDEANSITLEIKKKMDTVEKLIKKSGGSWSKY